MVLVEPAEKPPFACRFERVTPDGNADHSCRDFCAFEFPGCAGCPEAFRAVTSVSTKQDPLKSIAWRDLLFAIPALHRRDREVSTFHGEE
jgi:hypothetical protein